MCNWSIDIKGNEFLLLAEPILNCSVFTPDYVSIQEKATCV